MHFHIHNSTSLVLFHARVSLSPIDRVLIGVGDWEWESEDVDREIIVRQWKKVENCKEPSASLRIGWKRNCLFRSSQRKYSSAALPMEKGGVGRKEYTLIYWIYPKPTKKLFNHSFVMNQKIQGFTPNHCNPRMFWFRGSKIKKCENKQLVDLPALER